MKAQELRIGNLVLRKAFLPENNNYHEITVTHNDIEACVRSFADFEPIPLTEKWLLKFGFEHREFSFDRGSFFLSKRTGKNEYLYQAHTNRFQVKYVHQLQNLYFALTGCELEIK